MDFKVNLIISFSIFLAFFLDFSNGLQRCFMCRSRGELGSCKDQFVVNLTLVENKQEIGVETVPCASGWCGKIVESENALKEEYGVATQRICLQRGPSDSEDRCAYTKWNYKKVLMCFCKGDLCNSSISLNANYVLLFSMLLTSMIANIY
ncbi:UPAR/Ly6 domain-containing protein rtv-like [Euwallacea fornicatus]|uniref:UPAR/Ly6 domain-containing protein rtv-like n=1 Tax=Euwallacea fornicatus TaxID=995702 RepID=UPI00338E3FE1